MVKITQRKLAAILRESVFAPGKPGPLKVVIDVGGFDYYVRRAIEFCQPAAGQPRSFTMAEKKRKINCLTQAISLLAVAKCYLTEE